MSAKWFLGIVAAAALCGGCNKATADQPAMTSEADSLSYSLGMASTAGLNDYLKRKGIDTTYTADLLRGIEEGAEAGTDKKRQAYFAGLDIGQQLVKRMIPNAERQVFGENSSKSVVLHNYLSAFISVVKGEKTEMTLDEAKKMLERELAGDNGR